MNRSFIHVDKDIETIQYAKNYFSHHGKMFFPVQNNFPIERWEKLGFITFK